MDAKLTPKQEKFVQGLFTGLSQRESWKQAYPDDTSNDNVIDVNASRLANDTKIVLRLDQLNQEVAAMNMLSEGYVIQGLVELKERCMQKIPVMEFNKVTKEWETTGEWKFDSAGANSALEKLGKYLKMFTDKIESKNINNNLNEDITKLSRKEREVELQKFLEKHNKGK